MSANFFMKNLWSLDFTGFTWIFHLLSHSIFLIWPHFTTTAYGLYHSRYSFRQIHFRHLIFHMRLLCNMIVDIHCDLCIWMVFAPLQSVLIGCAPDIQHPITYCITLGLTLFSPSLVHPVCRRVCGCVKYRTKKFYFFLPKTIWFWNPHIWWQHGTNVSYRRCCMGS